MPGEFFESPYATEIIQNNLKQEPLSGLKTNYPTPVFSQFFRASYVLTDDKQKNLPFHVFYVNKNNKVKNNCSDLMTSLFQYI